MPQEVTLMNTAVITVITRIMAMIRERNVMATIENMARIVRSVTTRCSRILR